MCVGGCGVSVWVGGCGASVWEGVGLVCGWVGRLGIKAVDLISNKIMLGRQL